MLDRLEFQHNLEGIFQRGTKRKFDDCLVHLSEGARKAIEACMLEFYFSRRDANNMLREFTVSPGQNLSYGQMMYLLSLGHSKSSIYEVAHSAAGVGIILQDLIRGADQTRIPDCPAAAALVEGDKLLTRVVKSKTGTHLSTGTLVIPKQLWPHLNAKIESQYPIPKTQDPTPQEFYEDLAEEMTWYTISCWLNAYSGPGAPPPKLIDFDQD